MPYELAHGNGILTTAGDVLFIGQPDGNLLALDARHGHELWRFQTGAAVSASPITYEIDGGSASLENAAGRLELRGEVGGDQFHARLRAGVGE